MEMTYTPSESTVKQPEIEKWSWERLNRLSLNFLGVYTAPVPMSVVTGTMT